MAKPPRSPLLGYNHNVKYGGHIFHVQTEDSGPGNPHLFTHLFFEGSILASKRGQYDPEMPEDQVRAMMQAQHKAILKDLKHRAYDERISRFFAMRGQTFRADDFFAEDIATITPAPATPAVEVLVPPASDGLQTLDLDALPTPPVEKTHTPEPLPIHVTKPPVPGPGTYTFRRATREQVPNENTPPPQASARPRPLPGMRPLPARQTPVVVVQRQVVVGTGVPATSSTRKPSTTPVRRRPLSGGPYVVKEGSHVEVAGTVSNRQADPPPRPMTPVSDPAQSPRTVEPAGVPQEGAPGAFVTDQSLDDVILAYLSQGEGKR